MATKPAEEAPGSLKYKTWILKVSIHCEGCKKKVKKVLQGIEGVYTTTVDSQQHKVTVTGNVEAETLLKKLLRSGKHAELWPETKKAKKSKSKKNKNNERPAADISEKDGDHDDGPEDQPDKVDGGDDADDGGESDKEGDEGNEADGGGGGGGENSASTGAKKKKKKKKKKGQNGNSTNGSSGGNPGATYLGNAPGGGVGPSMAAHDVAQAMVSMDLGPSIQHVYPGPYPSSMYHQPPTYGLNYNTAYPTSTGTSYFAPDAMHSGTYSHSDMYWAALPSDSLETFYEEEDEHHEDENGCHIM